MKRLFSALVLSLGWVSLAAAATVTNTVSFEAVPNVESYLVEKQVGGATEPWVAMPTDTVVPPTVEFVDTNNALGVTVCYKITPSNTMPSTGASAEACSVAIGTVGDMTTISIVPLVVE